MKRFQKAAMILTGAVAATLLGCQTASVPVLYKAGSVYAQRQAVFDACKIDSLAEIPQALATRTNGGYSSPGTLECSTEGDKTTCETVGAVNIPPSSETYDTNQGLRDRYVERCLASRGYRYLTRPRCESEELRQAALNAPQPASPDQVLCSAGRNLDG